MATQNLFTSVLLKWNLKENHRQMPWKGEKNPYFIWLSEIILQQTKVEQGLPYFIRFKEKFPTIKTLALAKEDEVMKLWQGLGYYSRARNLHETAKNIYFNYTGKFPETFEELKKLKGVGNYTAAAIASFAFGKKNAVVDGNVIRVLARYFGIKTAFDTTEGKKEFAALAQNLIDAKNPGIYNQAVMDLGALVCPPQKPQCEVCPLRKSCFAKNNNLIDSLPYRQKKPVIKNRYFNYFLIKNEKEIFIQKRTANDIWQNLYELPLMETTKPLAKVSEKELLRYFNIKTEKGTIKNLPGQKEIIQLLSHRKIHFRFFSIHSTNFTQLKIEGAQKIKLNKLAQFAFPKTIYLVLAQNKLL